MKYFFNKSSDSMFGKEQNRGAYDVNHKAFSFSVCVDNSDPLRLGRIRGVSPFGGATTGSRNNDPTVADASIDENGVQVIPWSKDDPYLFNSLLWYATLSYTILYHIIPHYPGLFYTILYYTILYYNVIYRSILHYIILYHIVIYIYIYTCM